MKIVARVKLKPTQDQAKHLLQTLERCNEACNWVSKKAWEDSVLRKFDMYRHFYRDIKKNFGMASQSCNLCIAKVADSYRTDKTSPHKFKPTGAQPFDRQVFRFMSGGLISIRLINGRDKIPYVCGTKDAELLKKQKGQVDLMMVRGKWYIAAVCDIDEATAIVPGNVLGIDLGIVNIATDSQGNQYSGAAIESKRVWYSKRRAILQRVGTKAAKRRLVKMRGKQQLFQKHENHVISKCIVSNAERFRFAIAIEDLNGIRERAKASKEQRKRLSNWGFGQLREFIEYKAKLSGIPVIIVDPRNTSKTCPACGHIDKRNRKTQVQFRCTVCGHEGNADRVAAGNISSRGTITSPMFAHLIAQDAAISAN